MGIAQKLAASLLIALVACSHGRHEELPPLRVGTSGDFAPFSQDHDGRLDGFDVEVARRFAHDQDRKLELVRFRWPDLVADLAGNRFDVAMSGVTMRPERALAGTFTRPIAETGAVVLTRYAGATSQKELDRPGVRIAVNRGGHLERVARGLFPHAFIVTVPDNRALPALLDDGGAEAILVDAAEADVLLSGDVPTATRVGPLTRDRKAYLARDPALATQLDAWIRTHDADGSLAKLRASTLGPSYAGPTSAFASDLSAVAALIDLRLTMMPAIAAAKEAAKLPVDDPAQEEHVLAAVQARAIALRLEPDSIARFFAAQMEVGRDRQRAFLAMPAASRPPVERLDLAGDARPALAAISDRLVLRVAELARDPVSPARLGPARLADELDASLTPSDGRMKIARALAALLRAHIPG